MVQWQHLNSIPSGPFGYAPKGPFGYAPKGPFGCAPKGPFGCAPKGPFGYTPPGVRFDTVGYPAGHVRMPHVVSWDRSTLGCPKRKKVQHPRYSAR